ncbi:pilus assembly protein PilM [Aestuariibacter sp. AA17]|uniref:Pilus assembly protein PilM n=1 Tax=Fluctibacter corallii TaxID=2984329 RepID=A0ABT3A6S5_9ALTE|nr:pilus assembly protein PilM [Aestuariibacter sp. AA17]
MLSKLLRPKTQQYIGLDIGTRYVKAVLLEKQGEAVTLSGIAKEAIAGNAFAEREIKDFDAVSNALKKVVLALKTKTKTVATAIAGGSVISKIIQMEPGLTDHELEGQIEIEADSLIPYPLEEVYLDFEELGQSRTHPGQVDVLLSAAHRDMVDGRITLLREVEFDPKIVDIETYALSNALSHFYTTSSDHHLVCINLGASMLQVCVRDKERVVYAKEHSFGFDALMDDLSVGFSIERNDVEKQLLSDALPETWRDTTYPVFLANLQQQISRAMQLYISATHAPRPEKIVLTGGGAKLNGLAEELAHDLAVEIVVFDPFSNMDKADTINTTLAANGTEFAVAVGLASRSFNPCHI